MHKSQIISICNLIDDAKDAVRYFNQSGLQKDLKATLKSEDETRWNSLFEELNNVLVSHDDAVRAVS